MQLCLFRAPRLDDWERRPLHPGVEDGPLPGARRVAYVRVVAFEPPGPPLEGGPHERVAQALRAYSVFPPGLITGVLRRIPVEPGDTVGIALRLIPGVSLFFAARVAEVFDGADGEVWRSGFTYRTVVGHPELGAETFSVEKDMVGGRVTVSLRAWSLHGLLLSRMAGPFVAFMQKLASRGALLHLQHVADGKVRVLGGARPGPRN